jgi:hypothetical protein
MPIVDIDDLPSAVQSDICANLLEKVPFLREDDYDLVDVRNNLIGLVEPIPVLIGMSSIQQFEVQAGRKSVSEAGIRSLNDIRETCLREGKELDPILVSKDQFIDGGHRFELWRRKGLTKFPSVDINNLLSMNWERWLEGDDMSVPVPVEPDYNVSLTVYHGSFWVPGDDEIDDNVFEEPDGGFNDYGVIYFSDKLEAAKKFSGYNLSSEDLDSGALQVVLKGTLTITSEIRKEAWELQSEPYIEFQNGESVHIGYRDDLYEQARNQGITAIIVGNEYGDDGDDIAVVEDGCFTCEAIALKKPDGSFTSFMEPDDARDLFVRHVRKQRINPSPEGNIEP